MRQVCHKPSAFCTRLCVALRRSGVLHFRLRGTAKRRYGATTAAFPRGFTMIELLLVVVIIGIALGITMPSLVRSIQGQRLKTAARTMVTVARYARSMAVLKQTDLTLSFNFATGQIDLTSTNVTLPRFTRMIEGVNVAYVKIEGRDEANDGICLVEFKRNGICQPFAIKIIDRRGNYVVVKVDALAGVKATEYGNE